MYWYLPWVWTVSFWDELTKRGPVAVFRLEDEDVDAAAQLHSQAFDHAWSGDELASLLSQKGGFGFVARQIGYPDRPPLGFVLARNIEGEAEILTIAVSPRSRRQGVGRLLMDHVLQHLHAERAGSLFLEVDEENVSALALYKRLRFEEVGRRPAYYTDRNGRKTSAFIFKRTLR